MRQISGISYSPAAGRRYLETKLKYITEMNIDICHADGNYTRRCDLNDRVDLALDEGR
jgi:hypothetical protein